LAKVCWLSDRTPWITVSHLYFVEFVQPCNRPSFCVHVYSRSWSINDETIYTRTRKKYATNIYTKLTFWKLKLYIFWW